MARPKQLPGFMYLTKEADLNRLFKFCLCWLQYMKFVRYKGSAVAYIFVTCWAYAVYDCRRFTFQNDGATNIL